jgi:hypothetical protein
MMTPRRYKAISDSLKTQLLSTDGDRESGLIKKDNVLEYNCLIYFSYDRQKKCQRYAIEIRTTQLFSVLNYRLTVSSKKNKNIIDIELLGLKAADNYINEPGPASTVIYFDELYGENTIKIIKQDGGYNAAVLNFNVFKKSIELLEEYTQENQARFCSFKVAREKNTFT